MRDWTKAFRRGSFRGVPFWVDQDGPDKGRRVAVHDISGGEAPVVEDMGRRATSFAVDAYVASDFADLEGLALEAACDAPGPSLLILPMDPPRMVACIGCSRSREKDRSGYIGYTLSFIEAGPGAILPLGGLAALRDVVSGGLPAVGSILSGALTGGIDGALGSALTGAVSGGLSGLVRGGIESVAGGVAGNAMDSLIGTASSLAPNIVSARIS